MKGGEPCRAYAPASRAAPRIMHSVAPAMTRRKAFVFIQAGGKGFPGILAENCRPGVARLSWFPAGG